MPINVGDSIGRYHIVEPLGQGGMATVYKAFDTRLNRNVAIKFIRRETISPENIDQMLKRFEKEARALAQLIHPNIVNVFDYGEHEGSPYLVMQYIQGGTLRQRTGSTVSLREAARLLLPVARALDYAHQHNIIHRDVKPANILITETGDPMLSDFGIAKILQADESTALTGTGVGIGTPEYMAPEQGLGQIIDRRADIYALGIVFYELLTGRKPFSATTPLAVVIMHVHDPLPRPRELCPDLPEEAEQVLFKALAKKPGDRFQSMSSFAFVLEQLASGKTKELDWGGENAILVPSGGPQSLSTQTDVAGPGSRATMHQEKVVEPIQQVVRPTQTTGIYQSSEVGIHTEAFSPNHFVPTKRFPWILVILGVLLIFVLMAATIGGYFIITRKTTQTANLAENTEVVGTNDQLVLPTAEQTKQDQNPTSTIVQNSTALATITLQNVNTEIPTQVDTPLPGYTLGSTMQASQDGMVLVYVPAGDFLMGSNDGEADEKPQHRVYLTDYWIDRTEITNDMYALCVSAGSCKIPISLISNARSSYFGDSAYSNYPVIFVDWDMANLYCQWVGRRLPTEAEWEKAARGLAGSIYPWGNASPNGNLVNFNKLIGDTVPVGSFPSGSSYFNALDMAGNVYEWVADWYGADYYSTTPNSNPQGPPSGKYKVIKGGSWSNGETRQRASNRGHGGVIVYGDDLGFRCAKNP